MGEELKEKKNKGKEIENATEGEELYILRLRAISSVYHTLVRGMSVGRAMPSSDNNFFSSSDSTRVAAFLEDEEDEEEERMVVSGDGGDATDEALSDSKQTWN